MKLGIGKSRKIDARDQLSDEELLLSRLNTRHFLMKLLLVTWELLVLRCIALGRLMQKEAQKKISMHIESFMTGNCKLTPCIMYGILGNEKINR